MIIKSFALLAGLALAALTMHTTTARAQEAGLEEAIFAGGCFWCVESAFDDVEGVKETISGYVGGHVENPGYKEVSAGRTGHAEALLVRFDPAEVSYEQLLDAFWRNVDPIDSGGQFCDRGSQYRTGIFWLTEAQRDAAVASRQALDESSVLPKRIVTEITKAGPYYPAEDYHQDYHRRNPIRYTFYSTSCGRADRLKELWGPPKK